MLGRGGFLVHGGTVPPGNAKEGCVVLPRPIRELMWHWPDHCLRVTE
jgi:hypothetical protein